MRWLWIKILLGAILVFGVGYAGVVVVRGAMDRGHSILETSDPITIPVAFIPFTLAGEEIGTFQRVTIRRDAPKVVSAIDVRVRLNEGVLGEQIAGCRITTMHRERFEIDEGFVCVPEDAVDSALVPFGTIRFRGRGGVDATTVLLLDSALVNEMRRSDRAIEVTQESVTLEEAQAIRAQAERAAEDARRRADSIAEAVRGRVRPPAPPPPGR